MSLVGFALSVLMGLVLGLLGGGGAILAFPILIHFFNETPIQATGSSMLIVGAAAAIGVIPRLKERSISWKHTLYFVVPSLVGVTLARTYLIEWVQHTHGFIEGLYVTVVFAASWKLFQKTKPQQSSRSLASFAVLSSGTGILTGLVGVGGGFLIIPILTLYSGLAMRIAIPTSLSIIAINSTLGFLLSLQNGTIGSIRVAVSMIVFATIGMSLSLALGKRLSEATLKSMFAGLLLIIGVTQLLDILIK